MPHIPHAVMPAALTISVHRFSPWSSTSRDVLVVSHVSPCGLQGDRELLEAHNPGRATDE